LAKREEWKVVNRWFQTNQLSILEPISFCLVVSSSLHPSVPREMDDREGKKDAKARKWKVTV